MISIYQFNDLRVFLNAYWKNKKNNQPSFSIRNWSMRLGLKTHVPLYQFLSGRRKMPKAYTQLICDYLKLDLREQDYFRILVELDSCKTDNDREYYLLKLTKLSAKKSFFKFEELKNYECTRDPIHSVLLELTTLNGFQSDLKWIKKKLGNHYSISHIKDSLVRLKEIGLIDILEDGKIVKSFQHNYFQPEASNLGLKEFHENVSQRAIEAIKTQNISEREFNSYAISVKREKIGEAKQVIRKFLNEFAELIEAKQDEGEDVYQLNVQFFNMTKTK